VRKPEIKLPFLLACFVFFLSATAAVWASVAGSVAGTVTDPSGSVLPHASVTLREVDTGLSYPAQTDSRGFYTLPVLPVGLPSDLLQRRPDVASAERSMAAANARIGVARAAYFPTIQLMPLLPSVGWQSSAVSSLFNAPSELWAAGLSATQTVFDAGRNRANVHIAEEDYTAAVASCPVGRNLRRRAYLPLAGDTALLAGPPVSLSHTSSVLDSPSAAL